MFNVAMRRVSSFSHVIPVCNQQFQPSWRQLE